MPSDDRTKSVPRNDGDARNLRRASKDVPAKAKSEDPNKEDVILPTDNETPVTPRENDRLEDGERVAAPEPPRAARNRSENADAGSRLKPDPFDPRRHRLVDSVQIGVKKVHTVISCRKPKRQQFVRVHPSEDYRMRTAVLDNEGEQYLVDPSLWDQLAEEIKPTLLMTSVTRHNEPFLWPVTVPSVDRPNDWHVSAMRAAELAMAKWVRVSSNMSAGKYDVFEATGSLPEPEWPEMSFRELLKTCFSNRFIDSVDHDVLMSLRGEV